jgi:hypothetical protein
MICIKCGHANPGGLNYCQKCNAYLVKMAGASSMTSSIDVEEGKSYLTPQRSYPTEYLYNLTCRAYEYVHEGASGDPLLEAYQVVRGRMDEFEAEGLPALLTEFENEKLELPEDDYSRQMIYLLNKGVALYREGFDMFDGFIESGESQTLIDAVTRMQEGNDHLGLAGELAQLRTQKIDEELAKMAAQQRQAAATQGGEAAPPDAPAGGGGVPTERVDSTPRI